MYPWYSTRLDLRAESQDSQQRTHSRQAAANSLVLSWPAVVGGVWLIDVCCCTVLPPSPDIPLSPSPPPSPSPLPFGLLQLRQLLTAEIAGWPIYSLIITSSFIHSACIRYRKSGLLGCDDQRLITADGTSANLRHVCTLLLVPYYCTTAATAAAAPSALLLLLLFAAALSCHSFPVSNLHYLLRGALPETLLVLLMSTTTFIPRYPRYSCMAVAAWQPRPRRMRTRWGNPRG